MDKQPVSYTHLFDAGKSGTIDFIATPKKAGTFEGRVKVTYEDESMEIRTMEIPVTFEVKEGAAEEMCIRDRD